MASSKSIKSKLKRFIGKVAKGPSRQDLMLAIFDTKPRKVYFTVQDDPPSGIPKSINVFLTRVGKEFPRGSSETWAIDGVICGTSVSFTGIYFPQTRYGELFYSEDWRSVE
jgi:hypothetical protein